MTDRDWHKQTDLAGRTILKTNLHSSLLSATTVSKAHRFLAETLLRNMSTTETPLRVLLIGVPSNYHLIPPDEQPLIAKGLADVQTRMEDAGVLYEYYAVCPEEGLAALGPKLQSQRPDVVVIGNGIRRAMDLTPFMEQIIAILRASAPQAKFAFNINPISTMDAVKRWFPIADK